MVKKNTPDLVLWHETAKSVVPLKKSLAGGDVPGQPKTNMAVRPAIPRNIERLSASAKGPAQLVELDRRTIQRISRGKVGIEGRIDLHGLGLEAARIRLLEFFGQAQSRGLRVVLVITGKGSSSYASNASHDWQTPVRRGKLKSHVPEWFHDPVFREFVAGFRQAHPRHGGEGAIYVSLRRKKGGA